MLRTLLVSLLAAFLSLPALAAEPGRAEAAALVARALDHIAKVGIEQAVDDFNRVPEDNAFRDGPLYVFVYDFHGNNLASAADMTLPRFNLKDYRGEDGKLVIQQMIEMSKNRGGGAFEYRWPNPETGEVEAKVSYFKRIPDFSGFVGAGSYRPVD